MVESVTAAELRAAYGRTVEERFGHRLTLNVPSRNNPKVVALVDRINHDDELYALWLAANVNAVERLGMTDHGPVHVKIVMNIAVKLLRMLVEHGVEPAVVANYGMTADDARNEAMARLPRYFRKSDLLKSATMDHDGTIVVPAMPAPVCEPRGTIDIRPYTPTTAPATRNAKIWIIPKSKPTSDKLTVANR
jgi:hypothetical protein